MALQGLGIPEIASGIESTEQRLVRVEQMTASERNLLRRNQERFEKLPEASQQRLRELDQQLSTSRDGDRLRAVMVRYHDWLQSLPSGERAELLALSPEQRIPKIQEMMAKQESSRLRNLAKDALTPDDAQQVKQWFTDLVKSRKHHLVQMLPQALRESALAEDDSRRLLDSILMNRENRQTMPMDFMQITEEDRMQLVEQLSSSARNVYRQATTEQARREVVQSWVFMSHFYRRLSSEELQEVMQSLKARDRDRIENLPPEQMRAELVKLYFQRRGFWDGKRPPFFPSGKGRPGGTGGPGGIGPGGVGPGDGFRRPTE